MTESIYYERPVLLHREKHRTWRVKPSHRFGFAARANSLYLAGAEFAEAMKEYAIVFTHGPGGKISPVVMLGLRTRENLFVNPDQTWSANYVPAFLRRYPFVLAQLGDGHQGICIDEAYAGIGDKEGEPLFDERGANTPFLANALDFLERYQKEFARTQLFCQQLEQAGVLREMSAKADLDDGRSFTVGGLLVVDEPKLMALPDATVLALFRSGSLHLASMHLASLSNMRKLVGMVAEHPPEPAPKPG